MDDKAIIDLYFSRSETAIAATADKYGGYCYSIVLSAKNWPSCSTAFWIPCRRWSDGYFCAGTDYMKQAIEKESKKFGTEHLTYALYDLNADGVDELIVFNLWKQR